MEKQKRRAAWSGAAAWSVLALGWAACAALCFFVRTANARRMLFVIIGLATVSGWIFILLRQMVYLPAQAEQRHMASILSETAEEHAGTLRLSPGAFQIPKGIAVRKASLSEDGRTITLNIDARLNKRLPPDGTAVRVLTVRKYITAFEVLHE